MSRILIPAWSFYPSQEGGPSNALYWLASGLAKSGFCVRVVSTNRCLMPGQVIENTWTRLNGFDVIYSSVENYHNLMEKEIVNCDVLIANGVCSIKSFRLNKRALKLGKKVILSPRGELFDSAVFHKGRIYGLLKSVMFFIMKKTYGQKVLYHATSPEEVESIKKYMGTSAHISLIPNYMILPEKVDVENPLEPYLLYVGRLNHIKNIDIILSGLAKSTAFLNGNIKLKLAGEKKGEYYESLVNQAKELGISDRVEFLGMVTGEEKDKLYAGARCLLLMSKSENFGNVVVEALSQGTPAIASKGTPWKRLEDCRAGYWIDADSDMLAKTIDSLLMLSDESYKLMRKSAYDLSREFDIYSNVDKWAELINTL